MQSASISNGSFIPESQSDRLIALFLATVGDIGPRFGLSCYESTQSLLLGLAKAIWRMPEQDYTLVQRVISRVHWSQFNRYKAMVRSDYVLVREPALAAHLGQMLKQLD